MDALELQVGSSGRLGRRGGEQESGTRVVNELIKARAHAVMLL